MIISESREGKLYIRVSPNHDEVILGDDSFTQLIKTTAIKGHKK